MLLLVAGVQLRSETDSQIFVANSVASYRCSLVSSVLVVVGLLHGHAHIIRQEVGTTVP